MNQSLAELDARIAAMERAMGAQSPTDVDITGGRIVRLREFDVSGPATISNLVVGSITITNQITPEATAEVQSETHVYPPLFSNTSVGHLALALAVGGVIVGYQNSAYGMKALSANEGGYNNAALGFQALYGNVGGYENVALGSNTLFANTEGFRNTAVGHNALAANVTGTWNTAVGFDALAATTNHRNTAVGVEALNKTTGGGDNTALGYQAAQDNVGGTYNVAIGSQALRKKATGSDNIAIGASSLSSLTGADENVAIGTYAATSNVTGGYNVAVGWAAMRGVSTNSSQWNVAVGHSALYGITTGTYNTALGYKAGYTQTSGANDVALGAYAMYSHTVSSMGSVAVGAFSSYFNVTGGANVALGFEALRGVSTKSHSHNTAIGYQAGYAMDVGDSNTFVGSGSGRATTTGTNNTALGSGALMYNNTSGGYNVAVGVAAMSDTAAGKQGNVAIGYYAGAVSPGDYNVMIGYQAQSAAAGDYNVVIGYTAHVLAGTDSNSIVIGKSAVGAGPNTVSIGNTSITDTWVNAGRLRLDTDVYFKDNIDHFVGFGEQGGCTDVNKITFGTMYGGRAIFTQHLGGISPGSFLLVASDGTYNKSLLGKPDGTLEWDGNALLYSGITANITINGTIKAAGLAGAIEAYTSLKWGNGVGWLTIVGVDTYMDNRANGGFVFRTAAGTVEQVRITHTASAVNYLTFTGGATNWPGQISVAGSDTNIGIYYTTKGTGDHKFYVGATETVRVETAGLNVLQGQVTLAGNLAMVSAVSSLYYLNLRNSTGDTLFGTAGAMALSAANGFAFSGGSDVFLDANLSTSTYIKMRSNYSGSNVTGWIRFERGATWGGNISAYVPRHWGGPAPNPHWIMGVHDDPSGYPNTNAHFTLNVDGATLPDASAVFYIGLGHVESGSNTRPSIYACGSATIAGALTLNSGSSGGAPGLVLQNSATGTWARFAGTGGGGNFLESNDSLFIRAGAAYPTQVEVIATASAVNYLTLTGSGVGGAAAIGVDGSDTNADLKLVSKGAGYLRFYVGATEQFRAESTGLNVLSGQVTLADNLAIMAALGTNGINVRTTGGDMLLTSGGNIELTKSGYLNVRIAGVSSAINYMTLAGSTTGNAITIGAAGSDTDISVNISPKGAGVLQAGGYTVWHAGNDGPSSTLDADLVDGYHAAEAATVSTVMARNASGYAYATFFNMSGSDEATTATSYIFTDGASGGASFFRRKTLANVKTEIVTSAAVSAVLDADLAAIAALGFASTSFLKKTAADTWALDTNAYVTTSGQAYDSDRLEGYHGSIENNASMVVVRDASRNAYATAYRMGFIGDIAGSIWAEDFTTYATTTIAASNTGGASWQAMLVINTDGTFTFNGTNVSLSGHAHAASSITSGTMDTARLGSGTANSTTFLRGDSTWQVVSTGGDIRLKNNTEEYYDGGNIAGPTCNIDLTVCNIVKVVLTGNVTFTFTNPPASGIFRAITVMLYQDATGSRTAAFTGAKWTDGNAPVLTTTANALDILTFFTVDGGTTWKATFAMADVK